MVRASERAKVRYLLNLNLSNSNSNLSGGTFGTGGGEIGICVSCLYSVSSDRDFYVAVVSAGSVGLYEYTDYVEVSKTLMRYISHKMKSRKSSMSHFSMSHFSMSHFSMSQSSSLI